MQLAIPSPNKHNYFQREVDLEHEVRCDFLKTFFLSRKCVFSLCNGKSEKQLQFTGNVEKGGKVLGIYTEINDESMMVMPPDSQILKDRAIHCGYYFFGFFSAVGHKHGTGEMLMVW